MPAPRSTIVHHNLLMLRRSQLRQSSVDPRSVDSSGHIRDSNGGKRPVTRRGTLTHTRTEIPYTSVTRHVLRTTLVPFLAAVLVVILLREEMISVVPDAGEPPMDDISAACAASEDWHARSVSH
jgi:hypothetical protein